MYQVKKEYIGKTACFFDRVIVLKEKMSKKDINFLVRVNYEGIEKVEKPKKDNES